MKKTDNEQGYTMIETIMYISILLVLGTVLASYAHSVMTRYRIGRTAQEIIDLKKAITQYTAADENYKNLTLRGLNETHTLPLEMRTGNMNTASHALGGSVEVGPASLITNDSENGDYMFFITFDSLPKNACMEIITQGQFFTDGAEMDTIIINDRYAWRYPFSLYKTDGIPFVRTLTPSDLHLTVNKALEACSQKNNTITWIFS